MATLTPLTISNFLKSEVLRSDYRVVDDTDAHRTRFPHERKLEILHAICISKGYRPACECEQIRRLLYSRECDPACPASILLSQAYLPECIERLPISAGNLDAATSLARKHLGTLGPYQAKDYRFSSLDWDRHLHCLYLPTDIHALLIERDVALLSA